MPGVVLIVSIPDICLLPYFLYSYEYRLTRNTVYCAILSDQIVVGCPLDVPISYYYDVIYQPSMIAHINSILPCIQIGSSERQSLGNSSVLGKVYGYNSDGVDTDKGYKENNLELHISSICMPCS